MQKSLQNVEGQVGKMGSSFKNAGRLIVGAFAGGAAIAGFKSIVSSASNAQQSLGATETVFGKFADTVVKDSKRAANQFGLDANTYRENANLLGSLFSNQGVAADKLGGATKKMIGVGADLAATFGGTTTDAVGALSSAFKGEFDSLEKYGISLKESTVSAALAAKGQDKLTGSALAAAKQQAVSDLILQQSSKTRGAFANETGTLAHQQQVLSAKFENIKATIGTALLPVLTRLLTFLSANLTPAFKDASAFVTGTLVPGIKSLVATFKEYQNIIVPVAAGIGAMVVAFKAYQLTITAIKAIQKAWIAVQAALNLVMAANPIAIVVLALVGLGVALVVAYKKSETFRKIVDGAFSAVKSAGQAVAKFFTDKIPAAFDAVKDGASKALGWVKNNWPTILAVLTGPIGLAVLAIVKNWDTIVAGVKAMGNGVRNAFGDVVSFVSGIPGKIKGALSGAGTMLHTIGQNIIQGLVNGLESAKQWVINKIQEIADVIPDWVKKRLGIHSPSRVMKALGGFITQGLANGIDEGAPAITSAMEKVTSTIEKYADKAFKSDKKAAAFVQEFKKATAEQSTALRQKAGALFTLNERLKEQSEILTDLKQKALDYAKGIADAVVASGNLTALGQRTAEDGSALPLTSTNIITDLQKKVDDAKEFSTLIQDLTVKGLDKTAIQQLIDAGVDGGLATAKALAAGGPAAIAQVNSLQTQLQATGVGLGNNVSATMHNAGIQIQQGIVNGLIGDVSAAEDAMEELAKKLIKAFKKSLKIKSPSRVFAGLAKNVTGGIAMGLKDTRGVERATVKVADVMTNAFDPTLTTPAVPAARAGGSGGNHYTIEVKADATTDLASLGRVVKSAIAAAEREGGRTLAF